MINLKKRVFSVFAANLPEKGSFQRLSSHFDYRTFGARGILTLRETLSRGDAGGGPERSEWMSVANKRVQGDQYCYSSACNAHAAIIKPHCHAELKRPTRSGSASRAFGAQSGHPRRHAEFSSASRAFGAQGGRSMVEMLGVLAVIGVLSIGGIAGYTTAMSYYKSNEILNDVNLRATTIATDIATNGAKTNGEPYETDLGDENALGQSVTATSDNGGFLITVGSVDESTCRNILNRDTNDTPIMEIAVNGTTYEGTGTPCAETNEVAFLFANDLGDEITLDRIGFDPSTYQGCSNDSDCGENVCAYGRCISAEDYCSSSTFSANPSDCEADEHCLSYECVSGNCTSHEDCASETKPYCQKFQTSNSSSAKTYSMCVECTENAQCGDGYFCGGGTGSCYQSSVNRCYRVDLQQTPTGEDSFTTGGKTYYLSKNNMPWWDAENFCKALGKSLVPAVELNTKGVDGSTNSDWNGTYKTDLVSELFAGFGNLYEYVWTATDRGTSSSSSSKTCSAYYVYSSSGYLDGSNRYNYGYRALCW